ncbi:hypothetical protein [Roseibium sp.]|uniref:hypothetical protein n=1 Tax=Roseibium sp. TaxID=1936156 RepID=UPI00391CC1F7
MTVIASILGNGWFYQFSDVLVTRDSNSEEDKRIKTPLDFVENRSISGFTQEYFLKKTIVSNNSVLASFAGSVVKGVAGLKVIDSVSDQMLQEWSLQPAWDALGEYFQTNSISDVSFVISMVKTEDNRLNILGNSSGCERLQLENCIIRVQGSGKSIFLDPNFISSFEDLEFISEKRSDDATAFVISRLPQLYVSSILDENFDYFRTGGWFDVYTVDKRGFYRLDYTIVVMSAIEPRLKIERIVRMVEINGHSVIVEIGLKDQELLIYDVAFFNVKDRFTKKKEKMSLQLLEKALKYTITEKVDGSVIIYQKEPGKIVAGYTSTVPFSFKNDGKISIVIDEEKIGELIDALRH